MRMTNLFLISIIAICIMMAGCKPYQYNSGKESNETAVASGDEGFSSEFEKLQKLLAEEEATGNETAEEETVVEEVVEKTPAEEETATAASEEETAEETAAEKSTAPAGATTITVKEGELVNLEIKSEDPDADSIKYTFTSPLDANGKWQTEVGDAGTYKITITASDGELSASQDVYIVVQKLVKAPVITNFADVTVDEGATVTLNPTVTDPQDGKVTLKYSGWMTSAKKTTGYEDAGEYKVTLTATSSSGESSSATITVTVLDKNRPPKILSITNG
jgi:hypothetical protein